MEHWRRMADVLDQELTPLELYLRTHKRANTDEWVYPLSQEVHNTYQTIYEEVQSQASTSDSSGTAFGASNYKIWKQVVGKKGMVYGLGAKGIPRETQHSRLSLGQPPPEIQSQLDQRVSAMIDELRRIGDTVAHIGNTVSRVQYDIADLNEK